MKHRIILTSLLVMSLLPFTLTAGKLTLNKIDNPRKPKQHPYDNLLQRNRSGKTEIRNVTNNKLIVILVDFQTENPDDPLTTGNGKFLLEPDSTYKTTIGCPPHNREYFEANLDALRYYYLAASQNSFNLEYDVYPQNRVAYTLPHTMGYYNPLGASSSLFLERMEEYFKDSFELADSLDPEIDFSQYGHFMIIHAGSDWQHDYFGNTPSDLPSFFIRVQPGKEAIVDNGNVLISYACNVPSTISQDFDSYESDGYIYYTGYGALNGVMAHEFGHSMGLVDLYSTYSFYPMVGQFDIMDSGGSGIIEDSRNPGVLIEGILPALPGAFSRMLMFEDNFRQRGLMLELNEVLDNHGLTGFQNLSASSQRQPLLNPVPNIIKIPINSDEYILVENRSVDPDNDGGTAIKTTLDERVAWYPVAIDDSDNNPTYEYDYLLPSFIDENFNAIGGGVLVWYVDDRVLYQQGVVGADGTFINNFSNNTVNYSYSHRGVKVIEADGLEDIGNQYSWFWTGTPYEYFHKYKPNLDTNGSFVSWSTESWRPVLNSSSTPPLIDYQNQPSFYGLKEISQPAAIMSFKLSAGFFDEINPLGVSDTLQIPFPVISSPLARGVLPVLKGEYMHFYLYDEDMQIQDWSELIDPLYVGQVQMDFEPVTADLDNNHNYYNGQILNNNLVIPANDRLLIIDLSDDYPVAETYLKHGEPFSCSPVFAGDKLFIATKDSIYILTNDLKNPFTPVITTGGAYKLAATSTMLIPYLPQSFNLVIQDKNKLRIMETDTYEIVESYSLPENFTLYEPVINKIEGNTEIYTYYLMSDAGNIYKCVNNEVICIYHCPDTTSMPTNLAISPMLDFTYSPSIIFGQDNKLFAIKQDGSMLPGYPVYLERFQAKPYSHLKVRRYHNDTLQDMYEIIYIKSEQGGYLAINSNATVNKLNCIFDMKNDNDDQTLTTLSNKLFWFYNDNHNRLLVARFDSDQDTPILLWHGYRNGATGQAEYGLAEPEPVIKPIQTYIFPSPVKSNWAVLRVENPDGLVKYYIYDIAGNLLYKNSFNSEPVNYKDVQLDFSGFSSGVYLLVVQNDNKVKRTKFAIEK